MVFQRATPQPLGAQPPRGAPFFDALPLRYLSARARRPPHEGEVWKIGTHHVLPNPRGAAHHARRYLREGTSMPTLRLAALGFIAGFIAVLIFHQGLCYLFELAGFVPFTSPAWALDPIPPFGVPSVMSKAFWGGVGPRRWCHCSGIARARLLGELSSSARSHPRLSHSSWCRRSRARPFPCSGLAFLPALPSTRSGASAPLCCCGR
jgi:hypothetical protein